MNPTVNQRPSQSPTRLFLVGCSRSGTTVVQRALTEAYRLYSLPETDFFGLAVAGGLGALACRFGLARSPKIYNRAFDRLQELLDVSSETARGVQGRRMRPLVAHFVDLLDRKAESEGEAGWLEKTPKHFRHTGLIKRYIPDAQIIHVVRQGPDVVASIRDRAVRFPQDFARQQNPEYAVKLWNRAIRAALRDAEAGRAQILQYETFAQHPRTVVDRVGTQLELPPRERAIDRASEIVKASESWKANVTGEIRPAQSKFSELFDAQTRASILSQLDMRAYRALIAYAL